MISGYVYLSSLFVIWGPQLHEASACLEKFNLKIVHASRTLSVVSAACVQTILMMYQIYIYTYSHCFYTTIVPCQYSVLVNWEYVLCDVYLWHSKPQRSPTGRTHRRVSLNQTNPRRIVKSYNWKLNHFFSHTNTLIIDYLIRLDCLQKQIVWNLLIYKSYFSNISIIILKLFLYTLNTSTYIYHSQWLNLQIYCHIFILENWTK